MIGLKLQIMAVVFAVGAAATWLKVHDAKVARKTEATIVQRSETEGAARAKKSRKVHDAARTPGAAERLRADKATCPDC